MKARSVPCSLFQDVHCLNVEVHKILQYFGFAALLEQVEECYTRERFLQEIPADSW